MASTPFAPKKADNVTELFTNIAMVTVSHEYELLILFVTAFALYKWTLSVLNSRSSSALFYGLLIFLLKLTFWIA
jgi:hypothetical protein